MKGVEAVYFLSFFDQHGQLRYYERIMMPKCETMNERMYHWVNYVEFYFINRPDLIARYGSRDAVEPAFTAILHNMHPDPVVRSSMPKRIDAAEFTDIQTRADARSRKVVADNLNWALGSNAEN